MPNRSDSVFPCHESCHPRSVFGTNVSAVNSKADHNLIPVLLGLFRGRGFPVIAEGDNAREWEQRRICFFVFSSEYNKFKFTSDDCPPKPCAG